MYGRTFSKTTGIKYEWRSSFSALAIPYKVKELRCNTRFFNKQPIVPPMLHLSDWVYLHKMNIRQDDHEGNHVQILYPSEEIYSVLTT